MPPKLPAYRPDFALPVRAVVTSGGKQYPEMVAFGYEAASPYEMTIAFPDQRREYGTPDSVVWNVSLETLDEHLRTDSPAGSADFKIESASSGRVGIVLTSDEGAIVITLDRGNLDVFVRQARRLVPAGAERLDIDAGLASLLGRPAPAKPAGGLFGKLRRQ